MSRQARDELPGDAGAAPHAGPVARQVVEVTVLETTSHDRWFSITACVFLALSVWAVFSQTLRFDFVNYDDQGYVYENAAVRKGLTFEGIVAAFTNSDVGLWTPMTRLSHMLDCQLYGLQPWGHHLSNVLLHGVGAILLFLVLRQMTGALWRSGFVAAVFAVHPLHVESVAWVAERKDVLSGMFCMLTLWAYARHARKQQSAGSGALSFLHSPPYWLAVLLFAPGLMSKPMLVTLPFVLLLLDWWPLNRLRASAFSAPRSLLGGWLRLLLEKMPFLVLSATACVAAIVANENAGALIQDVDFPQRIGNALVAYVTYLEQLFYPAGLAVFYAHPGNQLPIWKVGVCVLVLLIISACVMAERRKHPFLLVGWLWYLGMLVPVIGIVQVGSQAHADRYTYLPQIGLYIILAWGAVDLLGSWRYRRVVLGAGALGILAILLAAAHVQTTYWQNSVSLWTHTLACTRENPFPHNNLGHALAAQGELNEAIGHYHRALQLKPDYVEALCNLGSALAKQGNSQEAIQLYKRALQLKPDFASGHNNLGNALARQGNFPEAIHHYEQAIQLKPDYAEAHNNLGRALFSQGNLNEAIEHYERALQLRPDFAEAHYGLGIALGTEWKLPQAIHHLQQAMDLAKARKNTALAEASRAKIGIFQSALAQVPAADSTEP